MKKDNVWKIGPTMQRIQIALQQITQIVDEDPNVYLDDRSLQEANVNLQDWDLNDKDQCFACLSQETFADLRPTEPDEDFVSYEAVEYPQSPPPRNIRECERSARDILKWFKELQSRKVSVDGCGFSWAGGHSWTPRNKLKYEELYGYDRTPPSVPWFLWSVYENNGMPHHIYYAWHGDEGREGSILRSELYIIARCMKGRMAAPALCIHNVPVSLHLFSYQEMSHQLNLLQVLLLSTHGCKARIIIAHFDVNTMQLDVKCSPLEQFNGFGQEEDGEGHLTGGPSRPPDFEAKRDLFFRWLNPICQGDTYLKDSKGAPEMVLSGPRGRKRLVPRISPSDSAPISDSSEALE